MTAPVPVMLSGETAAGKYPVEALKAMAMIAETTESDTNYESLCHHVGMDSTRLTISAAVSHAACTTASDIGASAIITASKSGETARLLSRFRPDAPIIACVLDETTCRQMNVYRGVTPLLMDYAHSTDELISMVRQDGGGCWLDSFRRPCCGYGRCSRWRFRNHEYD